VRCFIYFKFSDTLCRFHRKKRSSVLLRWNTPPNLLRLRISESPKKKHGTGVATQRFVRDIQTGPAPSKFNEYIHNNAASRYSSLQMSINTRREKDATQNRMYSLLTNTDCGRNSVLIGTYHIIRNPKYPVWDAHSNQKLF